MINRQLSRLLLCSILGSTTLISGCALVRKDSAPHQQLKPEQIKLADDIHLASSGWPQAQWWKQLNDPQLDALIQRTLSGSHTLAEAKLREEKAQSQADLLDAGSQLQVAALGMLNRQRVSANGFLSPYAMDAPALGMDGPYYTEATVGLFAGLDLDLWGVHRSAVAAAIGAHNAALAETAAVELSLTTGVAQLYYSMQASYQMLDLLEQTRDVIDYAVKAHQSKVAHGLEAQVPFHGARAPILAVDKQIAAVKGQITETRESLRALIGAGASDMPEIKPVALPQVQTGIPATLSYELLARRPDLQAMRWYVQASLDQVDSARALFYPSFDIKAFFGLDSIHLDTLFKKTSRQFNFIPGLKLPLFDGGRLNANLEGTRAASNMMIERYNQSVLNAVRDVAVNGTRLQTLNDEREMQAERVEATRFTQRAAEAAYQRGLTSRLQATEARLPVLAEEMSLLMLDSRRAEACSANFEKVRRYVKRLCTRLLPRTEGTASEELRLLSAITPKGMVFYRGTVEALADRYVVFRDDYGAVSRLLLELIRAEALARGYHIITCPCAMHPEDQIDHIFIPALRLAFLTDNLWHPIQLPGVQAVRCTRFVDRENLSGFRARLRFNDRAASELIDQAVALMAQAKNCHDELETYYRAAVDFDQVNAVAANCQKILGLG